MTQPVMTCQEKYFFFPSKFAHTTLPHNITSKRKTPIFTNPRNEKPQIKETKPILIRKLI